jgi:hypothetical protein
MLRISSSRIGCRNREVTSHKGPFLQRGAGLIWIAARYTGPIMESVRQCWRVASNEATILTGNGGARRAAAIENWQKVKAVTVRTGAGLAHVRVGVGDNVPIAEPPEVPNDVGEIHPTDGLRRNFKYPFPHRVAALKNLEA